VVSTPRSDTGARQDDPSVEQKIGKIGKTLRHLLISDIGEIRGQSRGAIRKRLRPYGRRHRPGSPDPGYKRNAFIRVDSCPSVVVTTRSDTGARHEPHRLEQKVGKFGQACRRLLILRPRSAATAGIATCQQGDATRPSTFAPPSSLQTLRRA